MTQIGFQNSNLDTNHRDTETNTIPLMPHSARPQFDFTAVIWNTTKWAENKKKMCERSTDRK